MFVNVSMMETKNLLIGNKTMKDRAHKYIKLFGLLLILVSAFSTGCSWFSPGSVEDPGEAVGAPTMPEEIREGYEEGAQYPEESF